MEFESPIRKSTLEAHIKIKVLNKLTCDVKASEINTDPLNTNAELNKYLNPIATEFEKYSLKWMPVKITSLYFLGHIVHKWDHSTSNFVKSDENINTFRQIWNLEEIRVIKDQYILHWNLFQIEPISDSSGQNDMNSIPYSDDLPLTIFKNPRARIKEKIRRARIRVAVLKLKMNRLIDSYYTKYGILEGTDKESGLSSEIDSNTE